MLAVFTVLALIAGMVGLIAAGADTPAPTPPSKPACTSTGCVRLHLGSDARAFTYNNKTQALSTASNNCKLNAPASGSIMNFSATSQSSGPAPGMNGTDIGVRVNSSGNGTPCGQVDGTETLTFSPFTGTSAVIPNGKFTGLTMDLEVTGNAVVRLDLNTTPAQTYFLQSGTSIQSAETSEPGYATSPPYVVTSYSNYVVGGNTYSDTTDGCAAPNSSGPNSGTNDNCEWTVLANKTFTQATLSVVNSVGTVSVEGSNDFGSNPTYDTQFYLDSAPTANNDSYALNQVVYPGPNPQTVLTKTAATGVLANDSDPDGPAPMTVASYTQPAHGSVTVGNDGSFTYTTNPNSYYGTDTFTYKAQDAAGAVSNSATVTINVNAAPIANDDGTSSPYLVNQDDPNGLQVTDASKGVSANDTDPDSSATPSAVNAGNALPAGSTVSLNTNGTFTFHPAAGYNGDASFTYQAQDALGATSAPATVHIKVLPLICSGETKSSFSLGGNTSGSFTLLSPNACKGYQLGSIDPSQTGTNGTVKFLPNGAGSVDFRGEVSLGPLPAQPGQAVGTLQYDPTSAGTYYDVPWCSNMTFDANGDVTAATIPQINQPGLAADTWCIAKMSETASDSGGTQYVTPIWQVFGHDDPNWH
jgi:hypothetical protein